MAIIPANENEMEKENAGSVISFSASAILYLGAGMSLSSKCAPNQVELNAH